MSGKGKRGTKSGQRNVRVRKIGPVTTTRSTSTDGDTKYTQRVTKGLGGSRRVKTVKKTKGQKRNVSVSGFSGRRRR
jgi:hypothetical protein